MTATTESRDTPFLNGGAVPSIISYPMAASITLYEGALAMQDANGRAAVAANGVNKFAIGRVRATATCGSTAGAVNVEIDRSVAQFANSATTGLITIADIGRRCYVVDDQTVSRIDGGGTRCVAGIVEGVDTNGVWVRFAPGSFDSNGIDEHGLAGADLSAKQYYCVKKDTNGAFVLAALGAIGGVGILMNAPASGEVAIVRRCGPAYVVTAGTIAKGAPFTSDANGKAVAIVLGKTDTSDAGAAADPLIGSMTLGDMKETTGIADTATPCFVSPRGVSPTTGA
jgi:hypothetical protein